MTYLSVFFLLVSWTLVCKASWTCGFDFFFFILLVVIVCGDGGRGRKNYTTCAEASPLSFDLGPGQ